MQNESGQIKLPQAEEDLPVGTMLSGDKFTITGSLGFGGFGVTYRATDNVLGRTIVIKECFPEDFCIRDGLSVVVRTASQAEKFRSIIDMFMREARSLAKLRHPNIVAVHSAFEENGTAYLALDLIDGPDLLDAIDDTSTSLSPDRVKEMVNRLLSAITAIHEMDLLHRDIAPDNIIIDKSGAPVLIDFGAARSEASLRTRALSALLVVKDGYSPLEFYVPGSTQTPSSDLYALGATLYHLLCGEVPPGSQARMLEVSGGKPDPYVPLAGRIEGYEAEFLGAIDAAMQINPHERLQSAAEWQQMISGDAKPVETISKVAVTPAIEGADPAIDVSLNRLIEETNEVVRKSRLLTVAPVVVETVVKTTSRPEWVEEFNQETLTLPINPEPTSDVSSIANVTLTGSPTEPIYETPEPTRDETLTQLSDEQADEYTVRQSQLEAGRDTGYSQASTQSSAIDDRWGREMSWSALTGMLIRYLLAGIFIGVFIVIAISRF